MAVCATAIWRGRSRTRRNWADGRTGTCWAEDGYQVGSDTGNLAWAMLALLGLHHAGLGDRYLSGALRIAAYVEKSFDPPGFTGGTFGGEPVPQRNSWKSTEHNVDLTAAFSALARATHDPHWVLRAGQARGLVAACGTRDCGCFAVGTGLDGKTPNRFLALDAQLWPLLALSGGVARYGAALRVAQQKDGGGVTASPTARRAVRSGPKARPRQLC